MDTKIYNSLQLRELFHIEFLRWLGREMKTEYCALKGGTNLRLFFGSFRYSEDMDLDIRGIVDAIKLAKAYENIFEIGFSQFRDTVISYLSDKDRATYNSSSLWDEIKLKVSHFIDELCKQNA